MKVDFNTYDLSIKELIGMVNDKLINIAPEYQRQFRWDKERQSSLIESIFLGIPIPSLFMATNADGTWELIDGVQRVSTILCFAGTDEEREKIGTPNLSELTLEQLKKLTEFNGKKFTKLPIEIQTKFATVYKGNIIKNLIMDCQSYTKYRPNETTGGIFVSWRRKEELPTGA